MKSIPAYFDGNTVKTLDDYPFEKKQRLIITVLDDKEQDIWQTAAKEKKRHFVYFRDAGNFIA